MIAGPRVPEEQAVRVVAGARTDANQGQPNASSLKRTPMTTGSRLSLAWDNLRALVLDHALLAVLEVQRAGISLVKMVAAGIVISILVVSAWMGLVTAAVVWAVGEGTGWGVALVIAALVNLVVAVAVGVWAKRQIPDLLFAATLRQLRKGDDRESEHADRSVA
jgi:uncharacterized membrane protein YqjE